MTLAELNRLPPGALLLFDARMPIVLVQNDEETFEYIQVGRPHVRLPQDSLNGTRFTPVSRRPFLLGARKTGPGAG